MNACFLRPWLWRWGLWECPSLFAWRDLARKGSCLDPGTRNRCTARQSLQRARMAVAPRAVIW